MRRSFATSVGMHLLVVVLAVVGLPSTPRVPEITETPISVNLVNLADAPASVAGAGSTAPDSGPASAPEPESAEPQKDPSSPEAVERPASPPTVEPKPEVPSQPEPEVAPPPEPEITDTPPQPSPPPDEPAPAPAVRPTAPQPPQEPEVAEVPEPAVAEPEPEPESQPETVVEDTAEPPPLPVASRKPTPPPRPREEVEETETSTAAAEKPDAPKPQRQAADFASVSQAVRGLETTSPQGAPASGEPSFGDRLARALGPAGAASSAQGGPVTSSEIDAVRRQIERCWNLPSGAKQADDLIVAVRVSMNADGTPREARIEDVGQMESSPHYRAAAESAVRAVLNPRCHPFKLPPEKYQTWKTMTLVFNPKEMFGT